MKINGKVWPDGLSKKYTRAEFLERFKKAANEASLNDAYSKMVAATGDEKSAKVEAKK